METWFSISTSPTNENCRKVLLLNVCICFLIIRKFRFKIKSLKYLKSFFKKRQLVASGAAEVGSVTWHKVTSWWNRQVYHRAVYQLYLVQLALWWPPVLLETLVFPELKSRVQSSFSLLSVVNVTIKLNHIQPKLQKQNDVRSRSPGEDFQPQPE